MFIKEAEDKHVHQIRNRSSATCIVDSKQTMTVYKLYIVLSAVHLTSHKKLRVNLVNNQAASSFELALNGRVNTYCFHRCVRPVHS